MLTVLYIEALLADETLADEVWAQWDAEVITDEMAALAWWTLGVANPKNYFPIEQLIAFQNHSRKMRLQCSDS
jgi:hypothetical protein